MDNDNIKPLIIREEHKKAKQLADFFLNNKLPKTAKLNLSASLEKIWTEGDLKQKQKLQNLVFPSGLGYDKSNDRVRTPKVNAIFGSIPILTKEISNIKNGEPIPVNQFSDLVTPVGLAALILSAPR